LKKPLARAALDFNSLTKLFAKRHVSILEKKKRCGIIAGENMNERRAFVKSLVASIIMMLLCWSTGFTAGEWIADSKGKCRVWNIDPQPNETVVWSGACVDGYASGTGTNTWYQAGKEMERYAGTMFKGRPHGKGAVTWANGARYEGDFVYGKPHGKGTYTWANGGRYDGGFMDGERSGKGTFKLANGDIYEGDFVSDRRTGKGVYTWANGNQYSGDFVENRVHGKGSLTFANGDIYEGDFVNDRRTGNGTYTWINGNRYTGKFIDGRRTGEGTFICSSGTHFTGAFQNGKPVGFTIDCDRADEQSL
jgi:hypothetical protein